MGKRKALPTRKPQCTCRNTIAGEQCIVCTVGSKYTTNLPAKHKAPLKQVKPRKVKPYIGGVIFTNGKRGISNVKLPPDDGKKLVLTKYNIG